MIPGAGAPKRLFLHVGTHKTGTTSFQSSLKRNRRTLKKQGWRVISEPHRKTFYRVKWSINLKRTAHLFIRPEMQTGPRINGSFMAHPEAKAAQLRAEFAAELAAHPEQNLIITAEAFSFLRTEQEAAWVRDFVQATGRDLVVLLVLRDTESWQRSWGKQLTTKSATIREALPKLAPEVRPNGPWYFDKATIRAFWGGQEGGAADLREIDYAAAMAQDGGIVPSLYREMGLDPAPMVTEVFRNKTK